MPLLDTTALIDLSRAVASPPRQRLLAVLAPMTAAGQAVSTSRINEAEFRIGGFRAANQVTEFAKINTVLAPLVMLEFDATAAVRYAQVQAQLQAAGRPAGGQADAMVAAVALVNGLSLITRNLRHFATVPGLTVLTY